MSPPCQPFTRNGKQQDTEDSRTKPLLNIIEKISKMKKKHLPRYLILENVKFFERSETCKMLLEALKSRGFIYRQFMVSPTDLGIPNQRARYFLIAKRGKNMKFNFDSYVKNWKRKKSGKKESPEEPEEKIVVESMEEPVEKIVESMEEPVENILDSTDEPAEKRQKVENDDSDDDEEIVESLKTSDPGEFKI